ncbi:MAG: hypothetical protein J0I09_03555 [Sphingobacteriia bacterium]|nr:hypothetical protein [Sphingobacteriia bacterium]
MENIFKTFLLAAISFAGITASSQSYTMYKTGPNTWGGPYVAPVWSKTYNLEFNRLPSASNNSTASSVSSNASSAAVSYSSSTADYTKKSRFHYEVDINKILQSQREIETETNTAVASYKQYLNNAVISFETGNIVEASQFLERAGSVYPQSSSAGINMLKQTWMLWRTQYYYEFLCDVKQHQYKPALMKYNLWQLRDNQLQRPNPEMVQSFGTENYFFYDIQNGINQKDFDNYTLENRFRADLYFVELLANIGKLADAKLAMEKVMQFYTPLINSIDKFAAQIAISYFYTGNIERSQQYLEYYCNSAQSYTARYAIIEELLKSTDGQWQWNYDNSPEGYAMVEANIHFLNDVYRKQHHDSALFNMNTLFELYVNRSPNARKFIEEIKPSLANEYQILKKDPRITNRNIVQYFLALKKLGDEAALKKAVDELSLVARDIYDTQKAALDGKITWIKSIANGNPKSYWESYFYYHAAPAASALRVFIMPDFCRAGGISYIKEQATPYAKELAEYTANEAGYNWLHPLETCGILPKFRKTRKYADKIE